MEISVGGSKTKSLDLNTLYNTGGSVKTENSSWLGNGGEGAETKKRKSRKELAISGFDDLTKSKKIRHSIEDVEIDGDDNSSSSSGLGQKINGDSAIGIPKRPRGSGGRNKFGGSKSYLLNLSVAKDELKEVLQNEFSGISTPEIVMLNGEIAGKSRTNKEIVGSRGNPEQGLTTVASAPPAKSDGGDFVKSVGLLASKDEVVHLKDEIKEIPQNKVPCTADDAPLGSSSLGSKNKVSKLLKHETKEIPQNKDGQMRKLNGTSKRKNTRNIEIDGSDGNQKQKEDPALFDHAKGEGTDGVLDYKDSSSRRSCSSRMKRKRLGLSNETVVKEVESSSVDLDPDDDLEQNAARMLSSRFDPSCTGFALKNTALTLLSANEGWEEKPAGSEGPMAASAEAQDRVLRPRRHQKGKGASRKRRHFYEIHSDDMDAHWFLNRKIKIFWPLDESWYYGLVNDYDAEKNLHHIKYDDRDEEWISLENERFKLLLLPSELPRKQNTLNYTTPSEGSTPVNIKDESFMESEPIISWLAHHRVKSSTSTCLRKQNTSRDVCNMTERETDKPDCSSALCSASVKDDRSHTGSEGHVPIVYVRRRRYNRFSDDAVAAAPWSQNNATRVLKLDTTQPLIQCNKFEICIPLWPMLTYYVLGADILWLLRSVVLLQFGTVVTLWPMVFLEVLFVDNIVGLRLFLFEGCLKQAVAFVFLVMKLFCEPEKDESINHQIPVTSIQFKLSFFHNFKNQKVFAYYTFSKVRDFDWQYLDSEFQSHCLVSKHLSLSECTYDNVKLLEAQTTRIPYAAQTEVFRKKSNHGGIPLLSSSRSSKPVPGFRTIYSLMHGNVPPFALPFTAAPNLFLSLHLKLLLERSISLAAADDPDDDDCSQFEISSESSSSKSSSHELIFSRESHQAAIDGMQRKSSTLVSDANLNEAAGNLQGNNRRFKDPPASNLKGIISVQIPTSDEVYRAQQQQMPDLTWNLSDGIICSPNQHSTGPKRSLWHHYKPFGDPWGDGKADFFGNGPKKPRTQVQYTLPYSNKGKGQNNLPYQRIRKTNDKKISLLSSDIAAAKGGGPRRNLELVACDVNILINGGDKGWRECGARVFLEADQQKEWKLAVKCSGELRYAYKVHQDLQPGSTNRYTHAMMWKGGKDWALEFPERSQWFVFKEMHEECHNRNIRAASIKNIPIPGVRLIQVDDHHHQKEECFTRTPWYLRQVRDDVEMAMDASHVMYDMDSEDEEWVCSSRSIEDEDDIISDELFEKVMDMLEKVSYAQKRDYFTSGEIDELIARITPIQVAKSIYDHWREKRQRKGMPLVRQLQPPLWEKYQQICREWEKLKPRPTTGPVSGSQEKASTAAGDKPPMFAFCLKPRGLELLNKGSKHRPHKKISLSGHNLGDHDTHHASGKLMFILFFSYLFLLTLTPPVRNSLKSIHFSLQPPKAYFFQGRRLHSYGFVGDERAESSDASPLQGSRMYSPRDTGHFSLDGCDASDWNHQQLRIQSSKSIRTLVSPKTGLKKSSVKRNNSKKFGGGGDWHSNQASPYRMQQLVLGGSDLDEFRLRDASSAAKHARNMAKLKRERAEKLMLSADLAIHKAVSALMTAEAIKASSCTAGDYDEESSSPPSTTIS
ncbi:hypothetical protein SSX86_030044 [Deinandra increscens subsp. villosa]|uniref:Enhancer of polycomb-like protein n=1 Tax=Deinandra increscens subsp. villosa TaxID=3103831 RepID=A0AAP0CBN4_9ASTR